MTWINSWGLESDQDLGDGSGHDSRCGSIHRSIHEVLSQVKILGQGSGQNTM